MSTNNEFLWTEGGVALPQFHRNIKMTIDQVEEFRQRNGNVGLYITAYRYLDQDQKGPLWADYFYNDFDCKDLTDSDPSIANSGWKKVVVDLRHAVSVYEVFYGIPISQMQFYFSGKKGLSLLIPAKCFGYKPHEYLNDIFKEMVLEVKTYCPNDTLDTRIYDRVRLWRLINSQHQDTGYYKVPLSYQEILDSNLNEIKAIAKGPREYESVMETPVAKAIKRMHQRVKDFKPNRVEDSPGRKIKFVPPCIDSILNFQIGEGKRNNMAAALTSFFKQNGRTFEDTKKLMDDWNRTCVVPSLPANELMSTVTSAYRTNKTWGCKTMQEFSECDKERCRFGRKR